MIRAHSALCRGLPPAIAKTSPWKNSCFVGCSRSHARYSSAVICERVATRRTLIAYQMLAGGSTTALPVDRAVVRADEDLVGARAVAGLANRKEFARKLPGGEPHGRLRDRIPDRLAIAEHAIEGHGEQVHR